MSDSRITVPALGVAFALLSSLWSILGQAQSMTVDHAQVKQWNRFADALYALHQRQLTEHKVITTETIGGYANNPKFYREVRYVDVASGRLLSQIRWVIEQPDVVHSIDVYQYDEKGQLHRDFVAVYLPKFRNAPIQTLVNLHQRDDELKAFRQFDASGVRIYEQCSGQYFSEPVMISLDEDELPLHTGRLPKDVSDELYSSCFGAMPADAEPYLTELLKELPQPKQAADSDSRAALESDIELLSGLIAITPDKAQWYLDRGQGYFQLQDFEHAVSDLSQAIQLDPALDMAWFWRGMALGRAGRVREGVQDLSVYIERQPESSLAYTKRGVRYIWLGQLGPAQLDLEKAVNLDTTNSEAHDDLGVIYAQQQKYVLAQQHFDTAIAHDPSYQKAHHNLAMVHYLRGQHADALARVDAALALDPGSRNGLMLKATILQALGRKQESMALSEQAEFMPEGNWSERLPVR